jgi:hypothetical protein
LDAVEGRELCRVGAAPDQNGKLPLDRGLHSHSAHPRLAGAAFRIAILLVCNLRIARQTFLLK